MSIKKQIIEIIEILKNIFRYAMFNYKGSHTITELSFFIEQYYLKCLEIENLKNKSGILKKYNFLIQNYQKLSEFFTQKQYYSLGIEANNIYHKTAEAAGLSLKEQDFVVLTRDIKQKIEKYKHPIGIKIALDNIRSPFNVGSIFRIADAAGIEEIILCGFTPTPENPHLLRAAMNSINLTKWTSAKFIDKYIYDEKISNPDTKIISVETASNSVEYSKINYRNFKNIILVFGNEEFGINENVLTRSDYIVNIPMFGNKNSLNVAVAAGIIVYSVVECIRN